MKITPYFRVGRKEQLVNWEKELINYWNNKIGAWRKC